MKNPPELTESQAQLLMSQLHDGELAPADARLLGDFLEKHPEALDWMENLDTISDLNRKSEVSPLHAESISSIQEKIASGAPEKSESKKLISFPSLFRQLAAAAAVAIVGAATWLSLSPTEVHAIEPNTVEFVETDIPNSSTYIYSDEEIGWTVVWVEGMDDSSKG